MKNRAISFVPVKVDGDAIDKSTHIFSDCGTADDDGETGGIEVIRTSAEESRNESNIDQIAALIENEKKTPTGKVCLLVLMVAVVVSLNILKGGGGQSPLGIQCGASSYWGLTALTMFWMCTISFLVRLNLIKKWKLKKSIKYEYLPGDIEWSERNTIVYPFLCSFAGLFAGLFGVGGGIVNGPLMLHLGVHPLVAASSTAVMIISTSAAAATMFLFSTLTMDYALFLFVLGTVSTVIGQFFVGYFVDRYRRYSYISMSIGFVVLVSAILLGVQDLYVITDSRDVLDLSRNSLCTQ
jgi:Sulfite exporter TauE/SafE